MKMIWLCILFCIIRVLFFSSPLTINEPTFEYLHRKCLNYMEWRDFPSIFNGLICGSKNIGPELELLFLTTGLYHLIVVSGSHLLFLDSLLKKVIPLQTILKWAVLFLFSLMCLFNPPILRAFIQHSLSIASQKHYLRLRSHQLILCSGLITLSLCPSLITSISLQLSWAAALCMSLNATAKIKVFLCLLYITPLLGPQSPVWGLNNLLFIAVFEALLFPISIAAVALPATSTAMHLMWDTVFATLSHFPQAHLYTEHPSPLRISGHWLFIFALQLLHLVLHLWRNK